MLCCAMLCYAMLCYSPEASGVAIASGGQKQGCITPNLASRAVSQLCIDVVTDTAPPRRRGSALRATRCPRRSLTPLCYATLCYATRCEVLTAILERVAGLVGIPAPALLHGASHSIPSRTIASHIETPSCGAMLGTSPDAGKLQVLIA